MDVGFYTLNFCAALRNVGPRDQSSEGCSAQKVVDGQPSKAMAGLVNENIVEK